MRVIISCTIVIALVAMAAASISHLNKNNGIITINNSPNGVILDGEAMTVNWDITDDNLELFIAKFKEMRKGK